MLIYDKIYCFYNCQKVSGSEISKSDSVREEGSKELNKTAETLRKLIEEEKDLKYVFNKQQKMCHT